MPREGKVLASADPQSPAAGVRTGPAAARGGQPSLGGGHHARAQRHATLAVLPGAGHEAIDTDPGPLCRELLRFLA